MIETYSRRFSGRAIAAIRPTSFSRQLGSIALLGVAFLFPPDIASSECFGDGSCAPNSCPAANSCQSIDDCSTGSLCIPFDHDGGFGCVPSTCQCFQGFWGCTDDCGSQCKAGLPNDLDRDGILDSTDNCSIHSNPQQGDPDLDGYGNRCDGDFDQDGDVDEDDADILTGGFCGEVCDLDENGILGDSGDFGIFVSLFGAPPGPSGLACAGTVPCPDAVPALGGAGMAGLLLTLIASAVAVRRRWMTA